MREHQDILYDRQKENDAIRLKLAVTQQKLEGVTRPCFEEPMQTYKIFTNKWFNKNG